MVISAEASIGFAVATLARSQLAGIGVGIALYFGEAFASIFLPDIVKYLPFDLATAAVGGGNGASVPRQTRARCRPTWPSPSSRSGWSARWSCVGLHRSGRDHRLTARRGRCPRTARVTSLVP